MPGDDPLGPICPQRHRVAPFCPQLSWFQHERPDTCRRWSHQPGASPGGGVREAELPLADSGSSARGPGFEMDCRRQWPQPEPSGFKWVEPERKSLTVSDNLVPFPGGKDVLPLLGEGQVGYMAGPFLGHPPSPGPPRHYEERGETQFPFF